MVADYMKTQMFAQLGGDRLRAQAVEISDPLETSMATTRYACGSPGIGRARLCLS
jgi:hypothetical protein